jgi:hypothetical protein
MNVFPLHTETRLFIQNSNCPVIPDEFFVIHPSFLSYDFPLISPSFCENFAVIHLSITRANALSIDPRSFPVEFQFRFPHRFSAHSLSLLCSFPIGSPLIPCLFSIDSLLIYNQILTHSQAFPVQVPPSIPTHSLSFLCSFTVISLLILCHFSAHFLSFICSFPVISLLISCHFSAHFL